MDQRNLVGAQVNHTAFCSYDHILPQLKECTDAFENRMSECIRLPGREVILSPEPVDIGALKYTSPAELYRMQSVAGDDNTDSAKFVKYVDTKPRAKFIQSLIKNLDKAVSNTCIQISGHYLYKGPDAFMGWHTNYKTYCRRIYMTYCPHEGGKSFFRYQDPDTKEIITSYDKKGWTVRSFAISNEKLFWHCVFSDTERYSFGFRIFEPVN